MRHRNDHRKLNRTSEHRIAMLRNMVSSLFEHGRIVTTLPKAKEARRYAERCITFGKKGLAAEAPEDKLHYRRMALQVLNNKEAVARLFDDVAPKYKDRVGGYTRVLKAGFRFGDRSPKAIFELV